MRRLPKWVQRSTEIVSVGLAVDPAVLCELYFI